MVPTTNEKVFCNEMVKSLVEDFVVVFFIESDIFFSLSIWMNWKIVVKTYQAMLHDLIHVSIESIKKLGAKKVKESFNG